MAIVSTLLYFSLIYFIVRNLWKYTLQRSAYSALDNVPGPPSQSFWTGNLQQLFDRHGWSFQEELAQKYGPVVKIHGPFGRRILYLYDPRALHNMIIRDQVSFEEGSAFIHTNMLIFGPGLLSTLGEQHRRQRKMLNPVFSINHMRRLLPIFYQTSRKLCRAIIAEVNESPENIDMLHWATRVSLELIGQGGLGYSFDPLAEDVKNDYGEALKSVFAALQGMFLLRPLVPCLSSMGPAWLRRLAVELLPYRPVQHLKSLIDIMAEQSEEIFLKKRAALLQGDEAVVRQVGEGKDIMSILMNMNMSASECDRLSERELVAQLSTMTLAATDTTANSLCRILHMLAQHEDTQAKLRDEIVAAGDGDNIPYDALNRLPYLDAVVRETLRLYPPSTLLSREATTNTVLPLSQPIIGIDGTLIDELPIPAGTEVFVGILGSNTDKSTWGEDTLNWKPERWLEPLPESVLEAPIPGVYSKLMTFLGGKRACIGFKFAETEIKAVLSVLLPVFKFALTEKHVVWNVATVNYPTVGTVDNRPRMPLKVSLIEDCQVL
ncbi:cytochrome P450 [Wolfiporia cocos MD-104 SS10]|uniref:Cytochrome P450 n=1 Tax=Wolfiporia cocos (strain MD-104) TaxID=742152 RepID=A0A2H3J1D0_WOLCO|nr:cytochrome P450 [Wolfiporia cocos MD-104 SS10]